MNIENKLILILEEDTRYPYCYTNSIEVLRMFDSIDLLPNYVAEKLDDLLNCVVILDPDLYDNVGQFRTFEAVLEQLSSTLNCLNVFVIPMNTQVVLEEGFHYGMNSEQVFAKKVANLLNIHTPECRF